MREMKDSGIEWIGDIPAEWNVFPVKRIFKNEKRIVGSDVNKYERLALTMNGVIKRSKDDNEGLQPEKFEGYQILKENEIVFKLIDLENVKTSRVGLSSYTGLVSPAYIIITNGKEDNRFFYYWFMFMYYNKVFNHLGGEGVRSALNAKDVLSLPIPNISDIIMKNISDYLDDKCTKIDTIIEKQQKIIEKLKEYKLSLITETVTKGLNPDVKMKDSGVEWIGEIPEEWQSVKIKYCTYIRARLGWKGLKSDEYVEKGFPLLSAFNIVNDKLVFDNLNYINQDRYNESPEIKLSMGDIILVKDGAGIGKCAIIKNLPYQSTTNGSLAVVTTNNTLFSNFLYYYFLSSIFKKYIDRLKDGMGVPHLFQSDLKEIRIVVPCYSEQQKIAEYLDKKCSAIDLAIEKKQALIEKLTEYKKSLIYEGVTGKKELCISKKTIAVFCPVGIPTNEEEYAKILLIQKIITRCGKNLKGRIHLMKILHALEIEIGFSFYSEYTRYTHGPYDKKIEKYESELVRKGWISLKKRKKVEYIVVNSTAYKTDYNRIFAKYDKEIERIIDFFKNMKQTSKAEKVATLLASWNDFLIDGIAEPTDDMIITDVMTNWTENKKKIEYATWQEILSQMKMAKIVPHGYGRHTIRMEGNHA